MKFATLLIAAGVLTSPALAEQCSSKTKAHYTKASYAAPLAGEAYTKVKTDIVETAQAAGAFNTLLAAADAAGLVGALKGDGPLTVFAPTDAAFSKLPAGTVETLLKPENRHMLADILKLHVIAGSKIKSSDLAGKTLTAETLNGGLGVDGTAGVVLTAPGSKATVVTADVNASNGIIHVIDTVLLPAS